MKHNTKNTYVIFDTKEFKIYRDTLYTKDETNIEHYCNTLNITDKEEYEQLHKLDAYPEQTAEYEPRYKVMSLFQAIWYIQCEYMSLGETTGANEGYQVGYSEGYHIAKTDGLEYNS